MRITLWGLPRYQPVNEKMCEKVLDHNFNLITQVPKSPFLNPVQNLQKYWNTFFFSWRQRSSLFQQSPNFLLLLILVRFETWTWTWQIKNQFLAKLWVFFKMWYDKILCCFRKLIQNSFVCKLPFYICTKIIRFHFNCKNFNKMFLPLPPFSSGISNKMLDL